MASESGYPTEPGEVTLTDGPNGERGFAHWTCPKTGRMCTVPLISADPRGWTYDGKAAAPTLSPSILCHGCGWHGFIRDGKLVDA